MGKFPPLPGDNIFKPTTGFIVVQSRRTSCLIRLGENAKTIMLGKCVWRISSLQRE